MFDIGPGALISQAIVYFLNHQMFIMPMQVVVQI